MKPVQLGFHHFLLVCSVVLLLYAFYMLVRHRISSISLAASSSSVSMEGLESMNGEKSAPLSCGDKVDYSNLKNLPLREYAIMSSFNSAYDGTSITAEQLTEVIARGYRFIDLNVFVGQTDAGEKKVYVGYSPDNSPTLSDNSLLLTQALEIINKLAFVPTASAKSKSILALPLTAQSVNQNQNGESKPSLENNYYNYPLFLHLRAFRAENSTVDVVGEMMTALGEHTGTTWFYRDKNAAVPVTGCTLLESLHKKIVVSMDIQNLIQIYAPTSEPHADKIPQQVRDNLNSFVNVFTGGHTWRSFYHYDDVVAANTKLLRIADSGKGTNVKEMFIAFPFRTDKSNPQILDWMRKFSVQTAPLRVYLNDDGADKAEEFFADMKKPMVPLSYVLAYRHPNSQ